MNWFDSTNMRWVYLSSQFLCSPQLLLRNLYRDFTCGEMLTRRLLKSHKGGLETDLYLR